jgi:hypothetical protein
MGLASNRGRCAATVAAPSSTEVPMTRWCRSSGGLAVVAVLVTAVLAAVPAEAQSPPDFLLREPRVALGFRAGYAMATASSELFDFTREQLTVNRSDFDAPSFGAQIAVRVAPRLDLAFDISGASTSAPSEFREWVDGDDLPIEQTTEFRRVPVTVGVKGYLKDRGRSVGRFAWIPTQWSPYLGVSAGWVWYRFQQNGDWVDYDSLDIFSDRFTAEGHAPTVHVYGGADWSLGAGLFATAEARYAHAKADLSGDFVGFDPMDLSGAQVTLGFSIRF